MAEWDRSSNYEIAVLVLRPHIALIEETLGLMRGSLALTEILGEIDA